jgi:hypothetical protein
MQTPESSSLHLSPVEIACAHHRDADAFQTLLDDIF